MNKHLLSFCLLFFSTLIGFSQQNALLSNGKLQVIGNQLSNQCGDAVQLRGMSTHAPMSHQNCYKSSSIEALGSEWGADVIRLAMYTEDLGESQGYVNGDQAFWNNWIDNMVDLAEDNGMYVIIDWHILKDNNPFIHVGEARTFFSNMSAKYKDRRHVIYEICNEPNGGVSWGTIKSYAEEIIPIIRSNDPDGIILVGTPEWCSRPDEAAANPLRGDNAHNVMYTVHFYANTHYWQSTVSSAAGQIPIFVSEWGSVDASGNGGFNEGNSNTWLNLLDNANGQKISHCNWAFVDKNEAASVLTEGSCLSNDWTSLTTAGSYIYNVLKTGDNFSTCSDAGDDDGDGVTNGDDNCANTPANSFVDEFGCVNASDDDGDGVVNQLDDCDNTPIGTTVNAVGCAIANDFISNACMGFNNSQNYLRSDFEYSYENLFAWNTTKGESEVYFAEVKGGELVIETTAADPNYNAQGIGFGENEDGSLVQFDMSAHKVIEMDVEFAPTGSYGSSQVLFGIQIEDADGKVLNADANGNDQRQLVSINRTTTVSFDFAGAQFIDWDTPGCSPCLTDDFDFTTITKIIMFCNPGAGEAWSKPEFTGTWTIDNFSAGYDEDVVGTCDATRDDDGDGVRIELDECKNTISGISVDSDGCAAYQLDDDEDGVSNADDDCPNTIAGTTVNTVGCDDATADDDGDGVFNAEDLCPATPDGMVVDSDGCALPDSDEDGIPDVNDICANTPLGETPDLDGCSISQYDCADVANGTASIDACGICSGGNTGITPSSPTTWYDDSDGDEIGDSDKSIEQCDQPVGYVAIGGDECLGTPAQGETSSNGCLVTSVLGSENASGVKIFPIPASDLITIDQSSLDYDKISILTLTGILLEEVSFDEQSTQVSVSNLEDGMYIIRLSNDDSSEQFKIEKN